MIVNEAIEAYLLSLAAERSAVHKAIEVSPPASIVGPLEGQLLYLLAKISGAQRILEIGTATGYSGLWFARALADTGGQLITIEREAERVQEAQANFERAGYSHLVDMRQGDAFEALQTVEGQFDLIFVDILRTFSTLDDAPNLLDKCLPLLQPGGLLVADNVLVDGEVIHDDPSPRVQGIMEWNRRVSGDSELETSILTLRDGIAISRKKT